MHITVRKKIKGYALPLALIYVAIFSIIVASIGPRSNLQNQTTVNIIDHFKKAELAMTTEFLMNVIQSRNCPSNPNYLIVCDLVNDPVSITITSKDNTFSTTLTYP
jgi:hypothetical protein